MKNKDKATIILFPTTDMPKVGDIVRTDANNFLLLDKSYPKSEFDKLIKFEIYILTIESIKDGDWYYHDDCIKKKVKGYQNSNGRKIIYTTDGQLIDDNVQELSYNFVVTILDDLNNSTLKDLYYDLRLVNPTGRIVNIFDATQNHSQCKWTYKLYYGGVEEQPSKSFKSKSEISIADKKLLLTDFINNLDDESINELFKRYVDFWEL